MRKLLASFLASALQVTAAAHVAAQSMPQRLVPDCGGVYGMCGFRDRETRAMVIPREFERVLPFGEGMAGVRVKGRYGFIDENGKIVVEPRYDLVGSFHLGLAEVLIGHQTGIIDRKGQMVVAPQFASIKVFTKDVLLARPGKWQTTDFLDHQSLGTLVDQVSVLHDPGWGLYHIRNGWITNPEFSFRTFDNSGRGLIWATTGNGGLHGLMRADGAWQVEPQYSYVDALSDERAIVAKPGSLGHRHSELRGAVDPNGKLVVPLRAWGLSYWHNGFGLVREGGEWGLIDKAGRIVGGRLFDGAQRPEIGDVGKVLLDGKWVGLHRNGSIVANPDDGKVIASCPTGIKLVKQEGKVQVLGRDDQPTVPYLLDYTYNKLDCEKPSPVRLGGRQTYTSGPAGGKWGYLGLDGRLLFDPPAFDNIQYFQDGHAVVSTGGKMGIIDSSGQFTVQPKYESLNPASGGRYKAKLNGREFWTSATGQEIPAPSAEPTASQRAGFLACGDGAQIFAERGRLGHGPSWGMKDKEGKVIIKPRFRALHCFQYGVAWAPIDARQEWCPIGPDDEVRDHPACLEARYPYFQTHSRPESFASTPYENSVLWSGAFLEFGAGQRSQPPRMIEDGGNGGTFTVMQ